jgi:hypothetical protein
MRSIKECPCPPYYLMEVKTCATLSNRQYWLAGIFLKHSNVSEEFFWKNFFWNNFFWHSIIQFFLEHSRFSWNISISSETCVSHWRTVHLYEFNSSETFGSLLKHLGFFWIIFFWNIWPLSETVKCFRRNLLKHFLLKKLVFATVHSCGSLNSIGF